MKNQFAMILIGILLMQANVFGYNLEVNTSYDHFRGMPDGSWNGNYGAYLSANLSTKFYRCLDVQIGGSYGLYNWDGRQNQVFESPQSLLQEGFVTAGLGYTYGSFNTAIVYDRIFTSNFGIYNLDPSVDQLRLREGFRFCSEEIGVWGTIHLNTANKEVIGLPVSFRAIDQVNLFWSHYFSNAAKTTIWLGLPYRKSLMYPGQTAGTFIAGFSARTPLTRCLFIDGYGSYMGARHTTSLRRTRDYAANICVGITYLFGDECCYADSAPMPIANNSNFMIDTNVNN